MTDPTLAEYLAARYDEADATWRAEPGVDPMLQQLGVMRMILNLHTHPHYCTNATRRWDAAFDGPCMTLRILAVPYADDPDFDPKWRLS